MIWQRLRRIPWATFLLLLIQILVFIWETLNGGSLNSNTLIRAGAKLDVLLAVSYTHLTLPTNREV